MRPQEARGWDSLTLAGEIGPDKVQDLYSSENEAGRFSDARRTEEKKNEAENHAKPECALPPYHLNNFFSVQIIARALMIWICKYA
jgi:hypothetical protein